MKRLQPLSESGRELLRQKHPLLAWWLAELIEAHEHPRRKEAKREQRVDSDVKEAA
jgi:hypothetical protein